MCITDFELEKAYSNVPVSSIQIARECLTKLKQCRQLEFNFKLLATIPWAKRILTTFKKNVIGPNNMEIFFPAYLDELNDFLNQEKGIISFLNYEAKVVTVKVSEVQNDPYPEDNVTIINPHIGKTSAGYSARLSAFTSLITLYDKWISLIETFLTFCK